MRREKVINSAPNHTYRDVLNVIISEIHNAKNNPILQEIARRASKISDDTKQDEYILHAVYSLAYFMPSPTNRQQIRTARNILREKKSNCTGYVILLGGILENLRKPYILRLVDTEGLGYDHIYIVTANVLDPVITQRQDGTDTLYNRQPPALNQEVPYKKKIDTQMITTINGTRRRRPIQGFYDTLLTPLLGDECTLQCNVKHASDPTAREECKRACGMGMTEYEYRQWLESGGKTLSAPNLVQPKPANNTILYIAGGALLAYLLLKKK